MSRSFHETRSAVTRLERADYSDAVLHRNRIERLRRLTEWKSLVKSCVRRDRRGGWPIHEARSADRVPIRVADEGPHVHYPAGPEDVRKVLRRLPKAVTDGLRSVTLCLGRAEQEYVCREHPGGRTPDPYTGRLGAERLPKVYCGPRLGIYCDETEAIAVYAYVFPPSLPQAPLWEPYLRLRMLATLVHEVAHHFDYLCRTRGGRARLDCDEHPEEYAEAMEAQWTREIAVPYVREAYPEQVEAFEAWVRRKSGARLSLPLLAGVTGLPESEGGSSPMDELYSAKSGFMEFATTVLKGGDLHAARLELAWELHFVDRYAAATEVVQSVLEECPDHPPALVMLADILNHRERLQEARSVALRAVALAPSSRLAWRTLTTVYKSMEDWEPMLGAAQRATSLCRNGGYSHAQGLRDQITALARLGRRVEAAALVTQLFRHRRMARYQPARERYRAQYAKLLDQCVCE